MQLYFRQADRAGIPVITSNSPIGEAGRRYVTAHTGPDDCALATQAAEMLADSLNGSGNIVIVEGTPGYSVSLLRGNCFLDKIDDSYPGINVLDSQPADWNREKAQTIMETYLTQYGEGWDAIKSGWQTGSGKQSPIDDAILAIQTAVKVANGIEVPALQEIEIDKITAENIDTFDRPTW